MVVYDKMDAEWLVIDTSLTKENIERFNDQDDVACWFISDYEGTVFRSRFESYFANYNNLEFTPIQSRNFLEEID